MMTMPIMRERVSLAEAICMCEEILEDYRLYTDQLSPSDVCSLLADIRIAAQLVGFNAFPKPLRLLHQHAVTRREMAESGASPINFIITAMLRTLRDSLTLLK